MRILIATAYASIVGGAETYIRTLIPLLAKRDFEVAVLANVPPTNGSSILERSSPIPLWMSGEYSEAVNWRPDVVFSNGLLDSKIEADLISRFPSALYAQNYYGTCISGAKCYSRQGYKACTRQFGLGCLTRYLPYGCGGRNPLTALKLYRSQKLVFDNLSKYHTIVVASRHMQQEYVRHDIPRDRVHVIPIFHNTIYDSQPPVPRPQTNRILFLGRLTKLKGTRYVCTAIAGASNKLGRKLTLVVAGDGPEREALEVDCRRMNIDAEFLGWIDSSRRQIEMYRSDLLLVPSVWPEPFGLVGVEAGSVGLPSVGFAVGGIPDWLIPGVSGELAPGEKPDSQELSETIVRALQDPVHWQRLRIGAWESSKRFSADSHLDKLIPLLRAAAGI